MSINRSGETTVELATQSRKSFVFYINFNVLGNFICLLEGLRRWYKIHNKNNTIYSKIIKLQVAYKIRNQFDIGLNATYAKLSGKWNEIPKWSGVTVSQLI